jgi:hypothetical protein
MEYRLIPKALNLKPNQNVALISVDALEEHDAYNLVVSFLNEVGTYGWLLLVTSKPQLWHEQLKDKDIMHRTIITRMSRLRSVRSTTLDRVFVIPTPKYLESYLVEAYYLLPENGRVEVLLPFEQQLVERYRKTLMEQSSRDSLPLLLKLGFVNPYVVLKSVGQESLAVAVGTKKEPTPDFDDEIAY